MHLERIHWYGHDAFRIEDGESQTYIDPWELPSSAPKADLILITHAHHDHYSPEDVAAAVKKMHDAGRGIIGMKIYGENGLESREQRFQSLKWVLGLGCVDCFTIGFSKIEQIDETLQMIAEALA